MKTCLLIVVLVYCLRFSAGYSLLEDVNVTSDPVTSQPSNGDTTDAPQFSNEETTNDNEKQVIFNQTDTSRTEITNATENVSKPALIQSTTQPEVTEPPEFEVDISDTSDNYNLGLEPVSSNSTEDWGEEFHLGETSDYDYVASHQESLVHGRIVGGTAAALGDFPFAAYVSVTGSPSNRLCTGALLSNRYVLVPASCVVDTTAINVRLATIDLTGTALPVTTVIPHPKYKLLPKDYNLALLKLRTPVSFTANIGPIDLAFKSYTDDNKDIAGQTLTVIGFGPQTATGTDQALRYVDLSVLTKSECSRLIKSLESYPYGSKQSCLGTSETNGLCGREDIGALVVRRSGTETKFYTLIGIVTYIHGCTSTVPSLFTRVGPHYDWIRKYLLNTANY